LYRRGELTMPASMNAIDNRDALRAWLAPLGRKRWIVDCQPSPVECQDSEAVLKYLAKYVAGSVIHDYRILSDDGEWVTFIAKNYRTGTREIIRIRGIEFVRRFCLHILPRGFHRSRNYGLFAARNRQETLPLCRQLLGAAEPDATEELEEEPQLDDDHDQDDDHEREEKVTRKRCPRCLLWALVWIGRLTAAEMRALQTREARLGELLLGMVTTLDVDRHEVKLQWQRDIDELRRLPLPHW